MSAYPIRIRGNPNTIMNWQWDEEGSWEDHGCPQDGSHVYGILDRHKSVIEIRNAEEAALLITSGKYHGDYSGWADDRWTYRAAVKRLRLAIEKATRPDV